MKAVNFTKSSFPFFALTLSKQPSSGSEEAKGSVRTSNRWPHKTLLTQFSALLLRSLHLVLPLLAPSPHVGIHLLCPGIHLMAHLCAAAKHLLWTYNWSLLLGHSCREEGRKHSSCDGLSHTLTQLDRKSNSLFVYCSLDFQVLQTQTSEGTQVGFFPKLAIGKDGERWGSWD